MKSEVAGAFDLIDPQWSYMIVRRETLNILSTPEEDVARWIYVVGLEGRRKGLDFEVYLGAPLVDRNNGSQIVSAERKVLAALLSMAVGGKG